MNFDCGMGRNDMGKFKDSFMVEDRISVFTLEKEF